ncbi:uncharacterized protein [Saccopteryx leptura]|uniref:uncharacterized protein n=1 Tax=Saccopteryx leptura TaxID=249018 RepID=UPI00339D1A24
MSTVHEIRLDSAGAVPAAGAGRERVQKRPPSRAAATERSELATRPRRRPGAATGAAGRGARRRDAEDLAPAPPPPPPPPPPPRERAGIYLGESASESAGRPRPRWRETIIRAGRGGGYGSSSVSSVRGTCRAGGRAAEKTNRGFFFLLLLLLPHRNTHKQPARGPSYRGGIAAGPGTNPPVGGGVPPCGLLVSEQNADRKCSCRNDSLHRRQTLTTTPSSPLHFRRRRRHLGSGPRPRRAAPRRSASGAGGGRQRGGGARLSTLLLRRPAAGVAFPCRSCGAAGPALPGLCFPGGRPELAAAVCVAGAPTRPGSQAALAAPAGRH